MIVDHLKKCATFLWVINNHIIYKWPSDSQYGFRSSQSFADLLKIASGRIPRAFNRPGATRAVALDIPGFQQGLACWSFLQA